MFYLWRLCLPHTNNLKLSEGVPWFGRQQGGKREKLNENERKEKDFPKLEEQVSPTPCPLARRRKQEKVGANRPGDEDK